MFCASVVGKRGYWRQLETSWETLLKICFPRLQPKESKNPIQSKLGNFEHKTSPNLWMLILDISRLFGYTTGYTMIYSSFFSCRSESKPKAGILCLPTAAPWPRSSRTGGPKRRSHCLGWKDRNWSFLVRTLLLVRPGALEEAS